MTQYFIFVLQHKITGAKFYAIAKTLASACSKVKQQSSMMHIISMTPVSHGIEVSNELEHDPVLFYLTDNPHLTRATCI